MVTVSIDIDRTVDVVWSGVVDAEQYPDWLIGAQEVSVPEDWPATGSSFEHRIGVGPFRIPGSTTVRSSDHGVRFRIDAGMGLLGEAEVTFDLEAVGSAQTRVSISETASAGPIAVVGRLAGPVLDRIFEARNRGSLRRLRHRLEHRVR